MRTIEELPTINPFNDKAEGRVIGWISGGIASAIACKIALETYDNVEQTGLTVQKIRTALTKLKSTGELTVKTTNKFSIITVTNYELYQSDNMPLTDNQQSTNSQLTGNQHSGNIQSTTSKEGKKGRTEEGKKKELDNNFENFWKQTKFPKRPQDTKGDMNVDCLLVDC